MLDLKLSPYSECCILSLGDSPVSEFYMPMFQNALFIPSSLLTPPMKMGQTECSKMSAHKTQTPGNHP